MTVTSQPTTPSPSPLASFDGLDDNLTVIPPDTMGAVGPNHLLVTLNQGLQVQNRSGAVLSSVSWSTFWSPVFSGFAFDPRAAYDPVANRFIVTMGGNAFSSSSSVLIAVTKTSDPTGGWNVYREDADPQHLAWADYPRVGFNANWIVMQANMWQVSGGASSSDAGGAHIWAFNKQDLYAGTTAAFTMFAVPEVQFASYDIAPAVTYDATVQVEYLVEAYPNPSSNPLFRVYQISGPVGSETLTQPATVTAPQNWALGAGSMSAPQLGSSTLIEVSDNGILNLVERNGSLWAVQGIYPDPNSTRSSVQWLQMTPAGTIQQFGRLDDPTGTVHYGYPSIAVNGNGDVAIGFSRFTASQYASAAYTVHAASDPAGSLRPETVFQTGLAPYVKLDGTFTNRWGDYSATVADPTNDAQFWTIQEFASTPSGGTSRFGTWWAELSMSTTGSGDAGLASCIPSVANGSVVTQQGNTSVPGPSFSYTAPSAQGTLLVVHFDDGSGGTPPTAATYGGQSLTLLRTTADANGGQQQIWYLVAPAAGAHTLAFTTTGANVPFDLQAETFEGVKPSLPIDAVTSAGSSSYSTRYTTSLTTRHANSLMADFLSFGSGDHPTVTLGSGQTQAYYVAASPSDALSSVLPAYVSTTYSQSYTFQWSEIVDSTSVEIVSSCE